MAMEVGKDREPVISTFRVLGVGSYFDFFDFSGQ